MRHLVLIAACSLLSTRIVASGPEPACDRVTADCLSQLSMEPSGPEMEVADPRYLQLVARGLAIVPELAEFLDDPTPTGQSVVLFGGPYARGDVAMEVLSGIIPHVPWLEFLPDAEREQFDSCGFCAYWYFVRDSLENRHIIRRQFLSWFSKHSGQLVFESHEWSLRKGYYVIAHDEPVETPAASPVKMEPADKPGWAATCRTLFGTNEDPWLRPPEMTVHVAPESVDADGTAHSGWACVAATISADGKPTRVETLDATDDFIRVSAATAIARRRYLPAHRGAEVVEVRVLILVQVP